MEISKDESIDTNGESKLPVKIEPICGFQQFTKTVGVQANFQNLLPPDMYERMATIEKSQKDHENLFGRLSCIIDKLSDRYNGGNYSPDRISSEGYASKNTATSVEDIFEVSSTNESIVSNYSMKESEDNNLSDRNIVKIDDDDYDDDDTTETERDDEDISIRKSHRTIRRKAYSDMVYDSFTDDKNSIKFCENKSVISEQNSTSDDSTTEEQFNLIEIGPHGTCIKVTDYNSVLWDSASTATRRLLGYVFDVETLATHSLTGRPSPAFFGRERPLKNQLDQGKIADIVFAVMNKTGATERDIRAAITTKCADTTKMYKIKQNRMKKLSL